MSHRPDRSGLWRILLVAVLAHPMLIFVLRASGMTWMAVRIGPVRRLLNWNRPCCC